jgi:hypothetical protein
MKRDLRLILVALLFAAMCSVNSFGQETTGTIEITTKDSNGAVVPGVALTVESTGTSVGFKRTVTTDDMGLARMPQVPSGTYSMTAAALKGFTKRTLTAVGVASGHTTQVNFEMAAGNTVLDELFGEVPPVDVRSTTTDTVISFDSGVTHLKTRNELQGELIPKGLNFSSILKFSPAVRSEPRSGQFQIDGASGSENTFQFDGQEVTNVLTGLLDLNNDLPFSQLQEVKIKFGGLEAEYAGATGGVVTVATRGGGNGFLGELGIGFRSSKLEPIAGPTLYSSSFGQPAFYPSRRDQYNEKNPAATVGGPIWRNHLYFFASYAPQIFTRTRTLNFLTPSAICGPFNNQYPCHSQVETYHFKQRKENTLARLDGQLFNKLSLMGKFSWNPIIQEGGTIPSYVRELSTTQAGANTLVPNGGRQNSESFFGSGTYTVTNSLIVTARAGHNFLNQKLGTYGIGDIDQPSIFCSNSPFSTTQFPAGFGCTRGGSNGVSAVTNIKYDATTRDQFDVDAAYLFTLGGRHELKGGYQYNRVGNKVNEGTTDQITLRSGTTGAATVGAFSGRSIPLTPGAIGSGRLSTFRTRGDVRGVDHALFIQDRWQPTKRLTLNLGVRAEHEDVPSYAPDLSGLSFGWGSKVAPRLGAAYDLTGDGKTKISAFYGLYYDRMKLTLARASFGSEEFHDIYFELFPGDTISTLNRETIFGAGNSPIPGGACPLNTLTPVYGRVRCDIDNRVSPNAGGPLTEVGGVDPDIKPFRQREFTATFQRQIAKHYVFSARYTRKDVLHAIEDAGFPNSQGSEYYIIGNPGEGLYKQQADMFGLLAPKPQRRYDALEFRFDRNFANHFFFNANYTYSRLYGNYSGLASSDEEGRIDPNSTRYFDQPQAAFTVAGGPNNGRLPTDRPHVFKFFGAYSLGWERLGLWRSNSTDFDVFTTAQSGTVVTSFVDINNVQQIVLTRRGDQGRTPTFTQTDFAVHHNIRFGKEGRFIFKLDADVINVFNQHIVTNLGLNPNGQGGNIINNTNFNPLDVRFHLVTPAQVTACNATPATSQQCLLIAAYRTFQLNGSPELLAAAQSPVGHNQFYNVPSAYQAKRTVRYGIRLVF